jgi:hypothetical protein
MIKFRPLLTIPLRLRNHPEGLKPIYLSKTWRRSPNSRSSQNKHNPKTNRINLANDFRYYGHGFMERRAVIYNPENVFFVFLNR